MIYGGTNFGHIGYSRESTTSERIWGVNADSPGTLTSYDYWAAIEENRSLRDKYYELKVRREQKYRARLRVLKIIAHRAFHSLSP